jgi:long-chain acyl-CoA synthetase
VEGFLTLEPEITQAMVFGNKRPHLVAVIVAEAGADNQGEENAARESVAAALERVNAALAPIQRVRRFILADGPFTVENGQMTPTLKVRRHVLIGIYGERLEALYRS